MRLEEEIKQTKFESEWHKLSVNIIFTYHWIKDHIHTFLKKHHITMQQFNVLRILRGQYPEPISTYLIRERLLDKMADVSRIVDRLEQQHLLTKKVSSDDKRFLDITITQKGLELLTVIDKDFPSLVHHYYALSEEEAKQANELLDKLRGTDPAEDAKQCS
ncbi:MAG: MarR family transcriptional regulator [Cytophagales bacterium]|nr:MAG: MarR family transcriptional regulator [Cytophagales bacterium]